MAPMADVTDAAFRLVIARRGKPDLFFTEFVSTDGLCSRGKENLLIHLKYHESERPVIAQIFGEKPEHYRKTAEIIQELGFDGIDINMGCPVKTIVKTGSCAALIKTPERAKEIIRATKEGAGDLPVSVKTRIGYNKIILREWLMHVLEAEPTAITLHLRTAKEMSLVDAHWELMPEAAEIVKQTNTILLGNGDVKSREHGLELWRTTGIDGVMLGRAIYGNPWLFNPERTVESITLEERFDAMIEHAELFDEFFTGKKHFLMMRKHLRAYATGFHGAKEMRIAFESVDVLEDVRRVVGEFRERHLKGELSREMSQEISAPVSAA